MYKKYKKNLKIQKNRKTIRKNIEIEIRNTSICKYKNMKTKYENTKNTKITKNTDDHRLSDRRQTIKQK